MATLEEELSVRTSVVQGTGAAAVSRVAISATTVASVRGSAAAPVSVGASEPKVAALGTRAPSASINGSAVSTLPELGSLLVRRSGRANASQTIATARASLVSGLGGIGVGLPVSLLGGDALAGVVSAATGRSANSLASAGSVTLAHTVPLVAKEHLSDLLAARGVRPPSILDSRSVDLPLRLPRRAPSSPRTFTELVSSRNRPRIAGSVAAGATRLPDALRSCLDENWRPTAQQLASLGPRASVARSIATVNLEDALAARRVPADECGCDSTNALTRAVPISATFLGACACSAEDARPTESNGSGTACECSLPTPKISKPRCSCASSVETKVLGSRQDVPAAAKLQTPIKRSPADAAVAILHRVGSFEGLSRASVPPERGVSPCVEPLLLQLIVDAARSFPGEDESVVLCVALEARREEVRLPWPPSPLPDPDLLRALVDIARVDGGSAQDVLARAINEPLHIDKHLLACIVEAALQDAEGTPLAIWDAAWRLCERRCVEWPPTPPNAALFLATLRAITSNPDASATTIRRGATALLERFPAFDVRSIEDCTRIVAPKVLASIIQTARLFPHLSVPQVYDLSQQADEDISHPLVNAIVQVARESSAADDRTVRNLALGTVLRNQLSDLLMTDLHVERGLLDEVIRASYELSSEARSLMKEENGVPLSISNSVWEKARTARWERWDLPWPPRPCPDRPLLNAIILTTAGLTGDITPDIILSFALALVGRASKQERRALGELLYAGAVRSGAIRPGPEDTVASVKQAAFEAAALVITIAPEAAPVIAVIAVDVYCAFHENCIQYIKWFIKQGPTIAKFFKMAICFASLGIICSSEGEEKSHEPKTVPEEPPLDPTPGGSGTAGGSGPPPKQPATQYDQPFLDELCNVPNGLGFGFQPKDLLLVMGSETGNSWDPTIGWDSTGVMGINQIREDELQKVRPDLDRQSYTRLSRAEQLQIVQVWFRYYLNLRNVDPQLVASLPDIERAALLYRINTTGVGGIPDPIMTFAARTGRLPDDYVVISDPKTVARNNVLDMNSDGVITLGDLKARLRYWSGTPGYKLVASAVACP